MLNSQQDFLDRMGSLSDGVDTTMVAIDKSNQAWSWRLDPSVFLIGFNLQECIHG